jgi:hypothetical protein
MADVTVEFGAKDAGLSQTLKNVQKELAELDTQQKKTAMSADEFQRSLSRTKSLQNMQEKLRSMNGEAKQTPISFGKIGLAAGVAGAAVKVGMMAVEAATASARAVVDGFRQAIDLGGALNDLSSRTGETAGNLLVLQRAFENTGVGADTVGQSINKLQKFMAEAASGGAQQTETLNALGISMSDLAGKTPTEQMQVLAQKIAAISDPAQRARASMEIFGKAGGQLLPLLNDFSGELDTARGQLGSMPGVMDRSAKAMDDLGDGMGAISSKAMEFAAGFIEMALPALNSFSKALSGVDAAGWGQKAMDMVLQVADTLLGAFKDPLGAIDAWILSAERFHKTLGNGLVNAALTFTDFLIKSFETNLPGAIKTYITQRLVDSALTFSRRLIQALMTFSEGLSTIPGFENAASKMFDALNGANESIIAEQLKNLGKTKEAAAAVVDEFKKTKDLTTVFKEDFFGAEEATTRMNEKFKELETTGTKVRKDFMEANVSTESAKKNISAAVADADSIEGSFSKAEGSARSMKQELSASAKLLQAIAQAEAKKGTGIGGLEERGQKQIERGQFQAAKRTAEQIQGKEVEADIRGAGRTKDRRSMADIGKDFGLSQQMGETSGEFAKRVKDVKEGKATPEKFGKSKPLAEEPSVDKPGKDGKTKEDMGKDKSMSLETLVLEIKNLVAKIEPKLPQQALA